MNYKRLIISLFLPQLAGFIGSIFTAPAISTWYAGLEKSAISPPNWVFAPVWTLLFLLMGISFYLVWNSKLNKKKAVIIFFFQLILNILWSVIFFGLKSPFAAFLEIIILWFAIFLTIIYFYKVSKTASLLLLPYILWVSFAAILNFLIWQLN